MNITFLFGNGFDLHLGMKTRYIDFYEYFDKHVKEDNVIFKWKCNDKENWSDLEWALGYNSDKIQTEKDQELFIESREELETLLSQYLKIEETLFATRFNAEEYGKEYARSMLEFDMCLEEAEKNEILKIRRKHSSENIHFHALSFNYTDSLDKIFEAAKKSNPIQKCRVKGFDLETDVVQLQHVHGDINSGFVLGVDNVRQINNSQLTENIEFVNLLTKSGLIKGNGRLYYEKANEVIANSHIICIYGMSLGKTDQGWWKVLINWLETDINNYLIIYDYNANDSTEYSTLSQKMRRKSMIKKKFFFDAAGLSRTDLFERINSRILIGCKNQLFKFPELISDKTN